MKDLRTKSLCILNGSSIYINDGELYCHASFGKLINELSQHFNEVRVCVHESLVKHTMIVPIDGFGKTYKHLSHARFW